MRGRAEVSALVAEKPNRTGPRDPSSVRLRLPPSPARGEGPAPLMQKIAEGEIDPGFLITHKIKLEDGPDAYKMFQEKTDGCIKVVINP